MARKPERARKEEIDEELVSELDDEENSERDHGEKPITPADVGLRGQAETGESASRFTYGDADTDAPDQGTISENDEVREGAFGRTFGEALTGGGTVRPGSVGGGTTGYGAPGSTHDTGIRGPGTVGEGSTRMKLWGEVMPEHRAEWERKHPHQVSRWEAHELAYRFGWEMASDPRYLGRSWGSVEPELKRNWDAMNPGAPWELKRDTVREAWESVAGVPERDVQKGRDRP